MNCIGKGVLAAIWLLCTPLIAPAARLEAVWIGPDGNGGEGDWNTPTNWNLGVVPNNGTDADGDGVTDNFEVRIDGLPAVMSLVRNESSPIEIAELTVGEGDTLNAVWPGSFVLRDSDSAVEVFNNGTIRLGGIHIVEPRLKFAGDGLRFSGNGVVDIGTETGRPAILAALNGGRIINGPAHTLRTAGRLYGGRIAGAMGNEMTSNLALTNEGVITVAEQGANLSIRLNDDNHFNSGLIQAVNGGNLTLSSLQGTLYNRGLIAANDGGHARLFDASFVNEAAGVVRADSESLIEFRIDPAGQFQNRGIVEAIGPASAVVMAGKQLDNRGGGVIRAKAGGAIVLAAGLFRPDPAIQIHDEDSSLVIKDGAVFENEGKVLSAGPGTLVIDGRGIERALVRGGEIRSGEGKLTFIAALLEDLELSGTGSAFNVDLKGSITVDAGFTVDEVFGIQLTRGDAVLRGPGLSALRAPGYFDPGGFTFEIAADHHVETGSLNLGRGTTLVNGRLHADYVLVNGILAGSGTVSSSQVQLGFSLPAAVSPGDGIGTLSIAADLEFSDDSSFIAELGPDRSDLLKIEGDIQLRFQEHLRLTGGLVGQSYVIAQFSGERTGIFDSVTPGYNVIYDDLAKQIRVQPIPEPASVVLAALGIIVTIAGCWRKRRRCAKSSGG